jgi:hypothetical protein
LKNLGKSNITVSAGRQLLDDVGRARQLAISQHTTVYMVFVKANFWMMPNFPNPWWLKLTSPQQTAATNLCDKQLTGYTFVSLRSVGDQPGRGTPRYLAAAWHNLPDGTFIASQKFQASNSPPFTPFYISAFDPNRPIYGFSVINNIPFPTEDSPPSSILYLPFIAFNYLGQLSLDGQTLAQRDEYIPLAQGTVSPALDVATKTFTLSAASAVSSQSVSENPPGNSTNSMYNIVHIDRLTGRATLEYQKVR